MLRLTILLTMALAVFGSDDDWAKVQAIKRGTEVRILRQGVMQPLLAKMDEATDENLMVVVKNEQIAVPREKIVRLDARPAQTGSRVTRETTTRSDTKDPVTTAPTRVKGPDGPSTSTSSNVSIGGKPDFETVYRKKTGEPKK